MSYDDRWILASRYIHFSDQMDITISFRHAKLCTSAEVNDYLQELRTQILAQIANGNPVII
jgi:hypothetical protein